MNENNNQSAIDEEIKEKKIIEKEDKILNFLYPIVGALAFVIGLLGFILTINSGHIAIIIFFIVLFLLGLLGVLYGVLLIIRKKKPDFLKRKKVEKEDIVLD